MNDLFEMSNREILEENHAMLTELLSRKKRVPKARGSKSVPYPPKFEAIWKDYPIVSGANKKDAFDKYQKRMSETDRPLELQVNIHAAVIKYAEHCKATGRYVMAPQAFWGLKKHFVCNWDIPKEQAQKPKEQVSSSYKQYDPSAPTDKHLTPVDRFGDV